jgi:hypothetical protein
VYECAKINEEDTTSSGRIFEFVENKSPDEQKAAELVERRGGEAVVVEVSRYRP